MVWLSAVFSEVLNDDSAKNIDQNHGVFPFDGEGHQELRPWRLTEAALKFLVGFDVPRDDGWRQFDEGGLRIWHRFL